MSESETAEPREVAAEEPGADERELSNDDLGEVSSGFLNLRTNTSLSSTSRAQTTPTAPATRFSWLKNFIL